MGRKQRIKEARRQERERAEAERRAQRRKAQQQVLVGAAGLVVVAVLGVVFALRGGESTRSATPTAALAGRKMPIEGRRHVSEGMRVVYRSSPPTSGDH